MNNSEYSLKELYDVVIKATYPLEINGKTILENETIAAFDKIQIANFKEAVEVTTAHGGYGDRDRVWWENVKEIELDMNQGIFSSVQLALMTNSRLVKLEDKTSVFLNKRVETESDEDGIIAVPDIPVDYFFIYNRATGEKITTYEVVDNQHCRIEPYTNVILDYQYEYINGGSKMIIGTQLSNGYFTLQGKTRVKDDITGQTRTGVLFIPKLKLMSDLSIRLGRDATPVVGRLKALALPVGSRGNSKVMEMIFLNDDIDSDM